MNEQKQAEIRRKLEDEDRVRMMREGGEDMRAQLEMERVQLSRGGETREAPQLTPQEKTIQGFAREGTHSGLGETRQAQMAMWGKEGTPRPTEAGQYRAGGGGRPEYEGEYFTTGEDVSREGGIRPPEQAYGEPGRQERASSGGYFTSGPDLSGHGGREASAEKARATGGGQKAEDIAGRAGEAIGRALRKTVSVTKEIGSGLKKGLEGHKGQGAGDKGQHGMEGPGPTEIKKETYRVERRGDEK